MRIETDSEEKDFWSKEQKWHFFSLLRQEIRD